MHCFWDQDAKSSSLWERNEEWVKCTSILAMYSFLGSGAPLRGSRIVPVHRASLTWDRFSICMSDPLTGGQGSKGESYALVCKRVDSEFFSLQLDKNLAVRGKNLCIECLNKILSLLDLYVCCYRPALRRYLLLVHTSESWTVLLLRLTMCTLLIGPSASRNTLH